MRYTFGEDGFNAEARWLSGHYGDYVPRFGLCMKLPAAFSRLRYCAFGPGESYIDKRLGTYKDVFEGDVTSQYDHKYVKPQESGSHFASTRLEIGGMTITAERPFSFNVCPYPTSMLMKTPHDFELKETGKTYVNLDVAMSGVGTNSCGPELDARYRAPKRGSNLFRIVTKG